MEVWWNKIDRKQKEMTLKYSTLLTSFYVSTTIIQKICGLLKIHSGRPSIIIYSMGLFTLTSSAILSDINTNMMFSYIYPSSNITRNITNYFNYNKNSILILNNTMEKLKLYINHDEKLRYTYLSIFSFIILEQLPIPFVSMLYTLLPSSILTYGVFARSGPFSIFGSYIGAGSIVSQFFFEYSEQKSKVYNTLRFFNISFKLIYFPTVSLYFYNIPSIYYTKRYSNSRWNGLYI